MTVTTRAALFGTAEVAVEVPVIRPYKYMVANDRIVLIDPATSEVVAEVAEQADTTTFRN